MTENMYETERYSNKDIEQLDVNDPMNVIGYIRMLLWDAKAEGYITEKTLDMLEDKIGGVETYIVEEREDIMMLIFGTIPSKEEDVMETTVKLNSRGRIKRLKSWKDTT